jgi:hypothetical protein
MKKIFYALGYFLFTSSIAFSQEGEFVIPKNDDVTLKTETESTILVQDVYSMTSKLKRKITVYSPKSSSVMSEVYISLESTSPGINMYEQLEKDPDSFSGKLTIETKEGVIYQRQIIEGKVLAGSSETTDENSGIESRSGDLPCTLSNIHNCVSHTIEGMGWLEFGLCLIRAPWCYGAVWVNCSYKVCIQHVAY